MKSPLSPVNVFLSYARKDERWKDELLSHLMPFEGSVIRTWHDAQIGPGKWQSELSNELSQALIFVFLISRHFVSSDACKAELRRARDLSRQNQQDDQQGAEEVILIPVIVNDCDREQLLLDEWQLLPSGAQPLIEREDRGQAWANVVAAVLKAAAVVRKKRRSDFISFFGENSLNGKYPAVFMNAKAPRRGANFTELDFIHRPWAGRTEGDPRPKGIQQVIPFQELQPVLAIDRMLREFGGSIEITLDEYHPQGANFPEQGALATGLGFNNLTVRLGDHSKLYQVTYDDTGTDDFCILQPEEHPSQIRPADKVGSGEEYALLGRILVPTGPGKSTPYLVCAGHTADGTASACNFLAENWRHLWWKYRDRLLNHHMAGILMHPTNVRAGNQRLPADCVYFRKVDPLF